VINDMGNPPNHDNDDPDKVALFDGRTFERTQGCWNCKHWSVKGAVDRWSDQRQMNLQRALTIALESPQGEDDERVKNIKGMVNKLDHEIARGSAGTCSGGGKTANNDPVGEYVVHNFLCGQWSGASGASIARGGAKADKLPEELQERLDGPRSTNNTKMPLIPGGSLVRKGVS
jgi:hypothetical protein